MRRKMSINNSRAGWKKGEKGEGELEFHIVVFLIVCSFFLAVILLCSNSKGNLAYCITYIFVSRIATVQEPLFWHQTVDWLS
jgi:hypothetical protein